MKKEVTEGTKLPVKLTGKGAANENPGFVYLYHERL